MSHCSYTAVVNTFALGLLFATSIQAQSSVDAPAQDVVPTTAEVAEVLKVFALRHAKAEDMYRIIGDLFVGPDLRQSRFAPRGMRVGIRTSFDPRTNSLIVVGPKSDLAVVESLVERLDTLGPQGRRNALEGDANSQLHQRAEVTGTRVRVEAGFPKGTPLEVLSVVAPGEHVKKGDLLLAINSTPLEDAMQVQQIKVEQALAAVNQSKANLANAPIQQESQEAEAELQIELAKLELREYQEGTRPLQLKLHEMELKQAQRRLDAEERLVKGGESDTKSLDALRSQLEIAETKLEVFQKFTAPKTDKQLQSAVTSAKFRLKRILDQAQEEAKAAKAALASSRAKSNVEVNELKRLRNGAAHCRIRAPHDGIVSMDGLPVIRSGSQLREGQVVLILIPSRHVDSKDQ